MHTASHDLLHALACSHTTQIPTLVADLKHACVNEGANLSCEIRELMSCYFNPQTRPTWSACLKLLKGEIETDDGFALCLSLPENGMYWLIEEAVDNGMTVLWDHPDVLAAFCQSAPLEVIKEMVALQTGAPDPKWAVLATINSDRRVFEYLASLCSTEDVQDELATCENEIEKSVWMHPNLSFTHLAPNADFVQPILQRSVLNASVKTNSPTLSSSPRKL